MPIVLGEGSALPDNRQHHENMMEASAEWLERMLEKRASVSETIAVRPDGSLNPESTADLPRPALVNSVMDMELTPNGLMKACRKIQSTHPDFVFSFQMDNHKNTFTYTVTKKLEAGGEFSVGDSVQWVASGAEQWVKPRKISHFSDDREFVFVQDSQTGIPTAQLEKR